MIPNARYKRFIYFIPLFILGFFLIGSLVQLLWNNVLVPVLHVGTVSFWQAMGILLLSKILFSSFGGRSDRQGYRKQKLLWQQLTPEQKETFRKEWNMRNRRWGYPGQDNMTGDTESSIS